MNNKNENEMNLPIYDLIIEETNKITKKIEDQFIGDKNPNGILFTLKTKIGDDYIESDYFISPKRTCQYRNCGCDISDKRPNAKYCSKQCKSNEKKYIKREDKRILDERNRINNILEQIKSSDENIIDLYKNIYK